MGIFKATNPKQQPNYFTFGSTGLKNHDKKCRCVRVESAEELYLRVYCMDLKLSSVSDVNHSNITKLLYVHGVVC